MDIIAIFYFIMKIVKISREKGIEAKSWIWKLLWRWFAIEVGIVMSIMYLFKITFEDPRIIYAAIPALALALVSAIYTVNQLKAVKDEIEEDTLEIEKPNLDHFR